MTKQAAGIFEMPIEELKKRITKVKEHLVAIEELLPGTVGLTSEGRAHSSGKYRDGEATALLSVLDVADAKPELFTGLAALDNGFDPKKFETDVLRDRLERASLLGSVTPDLSDLDGGLDDSVLHLGNLSRPVMLTAYDIVKTHAKTDGGVAKIGKAALEYYGKIGRASAATKKRKKDAANK